MNKIKNIFFLITIFVVSIGFLPSDNDIYFKMSKSIDVFGKIYKETTLNYVDQINPEEFMVSGIKGMLNSLDPYSVYIDESHQKDIDIITRGKYGGIGATVGVQDKKVTIIDLLEGYSAQRQGVRIGDVILKVDSVDVGIENYNELGNYLKKEPGTFLSLTVKRHGREEPIIFDLRTEEVEVKNITYFGFVPEASNNAYIKLSGFSRAAGEEVKTALLDLKRQKEINSLVLDLRGNPGGLLDAAIDICEKFLQKRELVVSVIGRDTTRINKFYSEEEPLAKDIKMTVLVNGGSASASEIVAGAIQDHDRGLILGTRSFGKGLVQTIIPLSINTSLKLTTARYYTPSGRCIQKIDYSKMNKVFENNALDEQSNFYTDNNREVFSNGGIDPDSVVKYFSDSEQVRDLLAKGTFFKFVTHVYNDNVKDKVNDYKDEFLIMEFFDYLKETEYAYSSKSQKLLDKLKLQITKDDLEKTSSDELAALSNSINDKTTSELKTKRKELLSEIRKELAARIHGRSGRIIESLKYDNQFEEALSIMKNEELYFSLLKVNK